MKIILEFTYHQRIIVIPEGYISDIKEFQRECTEWIYNQPEYWVIGRNNTLVCSYGENDILRYVNEILIADSGEKAYLLDESVEDKECKNLLYF